MQEGHLSAKDFPQWAHPKGLSPVWLRRCPWSSQGRENAFPQTLQVALWVGIHLPALVREVVGEHVHRQGWHAHVHLATHRAFLGIVGIQRSVGLQSKWSRISGFDKVVTCLCLLKLLLVA